MKCDPRSLTIAQYQLYVIHSHSIELPQVSVLNAFNGHNLRPVNSHGCLKSSGYISVLARLRRQWHMNKVLLQTGHYEIQSKN